MDPATSVLKIESGGGRSYSGLTRRRENGEFQCSVFQTGKTRGICLKVLKCVLTQGKF